MGAVDPVTHKRMASVRKYGTAPELAVENILDSLGVDYQRNVRQLPGTPDLYLATKSTPVFVHGCFWHRHAGCSRSSIPKTNRTYWETKFSDNVKRDKRVLRELRYLGLRPMVIWQCETTDIPKLTKRIKRRLLR